MILVNKKYPIKELQKAVLAMQRRPVKQTKETVAVAENSNESPTNEHLTNAALQLIKEAQSIPPMKYLEAIKSEKGGYVSKQENLVTARPCFSIRSFQQCDQCFAELCIGDQK